MDEEEEGDRNSSEALETYLLTTMMVGDKDTCTDALAAKNTPISTATAPAVEPAITKRKAMHGLATASLNEQSERDDGGWRSAFEQFSDVWTFDIEAHHAALEKFRDTLRDARRTDVDSPMLNQWSCDHHPSEQSKCDDGGWEITFERFLDVWLNGQFSPPTVDMGHQPK